MPFNIEEFLSLWQEYYKKSNKFIPFLLPKFKSILQKNIQYINNTLEKLNIDTKEAFTLWKKFDKKRKLWHIKEFIINHEKVFIHYKLQEYLEQKTFLEYIENNLDFCIKNFKFLPKDYQEKIKKIIEES